jgi:hypothetical protein
MISVASVTRTGIKKASATFTLRLGAIQAPGLTKQTPEIIPAIRVMVAPE